MCLNHKNRISQTSNSELMDCALKTKYMHDELNYPMQHTENSPANGVPLIFGSVVLLNELQ